MATIWVLGASDPEMAAIERLLVERCCAYGYAAVGETRVHPGNAYRAEMALSQILWVLPDAIKDRVVFVECGAAPGSPLSSVRRPVIVDHHRPGDPGYGRPPKEYWEASSIGQVCALIGVAPTPELRLVAAGDHCPGAAYRGECPGVDPDELMAWRIRTRAEFQGVDPDTLMTTVSKTREALRSLVKATPLGVLADLGDGTLPEVPEAALREGIATIATVRERDGRRKLVLGGGSQNQEAIVTAFLAAASVGEVLGRTVDPVSAYGDSARGFAGAYLV